ncbi:MAG TPA: tRNA (adenosine(37)-N6)-threonylcarbamoyltransferase complex ATPase subunit type 1 TsaE [Planctomycetota bacterium]|jgi:tRNA threonylcarbamoyladenosine biosynthesis protein TsaE|nr:tRNA (adenosine(37)-N6)-threonylcarbamoyltransferase complex ATPase subunit type 1 TsaE [Planctomycetota bacterium]
MEFRILASGTSASPEDTEALGHGLGQLLPAGTLIALHGDLGTGKTCLVRGLARGLGLEHPISSPSYTLMQTHEGGRLPLHHFDAWMEGRQKAFLGDGALEAWEGDGISVVEWAERVQDWLPDPHVVVALRYPEQGQSMIERHIQVGIRGQGALQWLDVGLETLKEGGNLAWLEPKKPGEGEPLPPAGRWGER